MIDPNFLVIGTQKAGTTWLANMMGQHPEIFTSPVKELHFFNMRTNYERGIEWYQHQFVGYNGEKAVGEFTPNYLWISEAKKSLEYRNKNQRISKLTFEHYPQLNNNIPKLVYKHYPKIKLVLVLRDPVDRAISCYYHHIRQRRVSPTSRLMDVGHRQGIISMGFYYTYLCEWLKYFPIDQFLILIYENDIVRNKKQTLRHIFKFLNVDEHFTPLNLGKKYNARFGYLYLYLHYYFPTVIESMLPLFPTLRHIDFPKIRVTDDEYDQLISIYEQENRKLETLLGRSLAAWHPR